MPVQMNKDALSAFFDSEFSQVSRQFRVEHVAPMAVDLRLLVGEEHLRPGGTVSGPSMFGLADLAIYAAILAMIGPVALTVTTNASIDFLRKPAAGRDLIGRARLLKLGRSLAVGDVLIVNDGSEDVLARASMTYAIPPNR